MLQKVLVILSFGLPVVLCSYGGHDLFTSLSQLHSLWKNEQAFVNKMEEAVANMETMVEAMKRYVKSYKAIELDKEPNFDYLGHPVNSYMLVRHVAFAYEFLSGKFETMANATKEFLDAVRERPEEEMLPAARDVEGAAFGIARLHSLYGIDTDKLFDDGVISTHFNNKDVLSAPSVLKFSSWDMTLMGSQSSSNGLYNTMIDAYQKAIKKLKEEEETGDFNGDIFNQPKVDKKSLDGLYRTAIKVHDHNLDKRGPRQGGARTHDLPVDEKLRKKKKYHKKKRKEDTYEPIRVAMPRNDMNHDKEEEYNFKTNYQMSMLCAGETFRTPEEDKDMYCFYGHNGSPWLRLGPIKMELKNFDPYIVVIRNLLYEHECNNVTQFLAPRLGFPPGRMNGRAALNDWTMKNVWPDENDNVVLDKLTRRVEHVMGILAASNKGHSDNFMCGNYGIGGHYGTHPDYYDYDERKFYDPESKINRISTVMAVLEAPEAGGATAFPFVGVTAIPEKGSAVAWFNTKTDAEVDLETQHAACPVLLGQKWIGNKWISYKSQWQTKPCTLKPRARISGTFA